MIKFLILAIITLLSPLQAEDNPFETKAGYSHYHFLKENISKKKLTTSENQALFALCKIGLNADGGIWENNNINAAIATIKFGENWPDKSQATAYKTCNYGGYID